MRRTLTCLPVFLLFLVPGLNVGQEASTSPRPNVLLIVVDTLRPDHLGSYGYFRATSPHMDALAAAGVRFTQAVTVMSHTLPAHISMFTSRYPDEHGILMNGQTYDGRFPALASRLQAAGYATGAFVSGAPVNSGSGTSIGFDQFQDAAVSKADGQEAATSCMSWIGKQKDRPFFAWLHLFDPHTPYQPPAHLERLFSTDEDLRAGVQGKGTSSILEWGNKQDGIGITRLPTLAGETPFFQQINLYDAEIVHADQQIGRVISFLKTQDLLDNTMIILTSDHGEGLGEHDFWFHGLYLYDEQLRIPMIWLLPGNGRQGTTVHKQVGLLDLLPTVLDYLDLEVPSGLGGNSLVPMLQGGRRRGGTRPAFSRRRAYPSRKPNSPSRWEQRGRLYAMRTPEWKLVLELSRHSNAVVLKEELFSLQEDPEELYDLAQEKPERTARLRRELLSWLQAMPTAAGLQELEMSEEERKKLRSLGYVDGD